MSKSAKNDKTKTNVMRLLDAAKISYESKEYPVDEHDLSTASSLNNVFVKKSSLFYKRMSAHIFVPLSLYFITVNAASVQTC